MRFGWAVRERARVCVSIYVHERACVSISACLYGGHVSSWCVWVCFSVCACVCVLYVIANGNTLGITPRPTCPFIRVPLQFILFY